MIQKTQQQKLKELNKLFKEAKKEEELFKQGVIELNKKYSKRKELDWCGVQNKINTLNGLLNFKEKFLFLDREGNLNLTKFTGHEFKRNAKFFDGWMVGTIENIPKGNIICPESWIKQFKVKPNKITVTFTTPDYDHFGVVMEDEKVIIKSYYKNNGVLNEK